MPHNYPLITMSEDEISERLKQSNEIPNNEAYPSALLSDAPKPAAVLVPLLKRHPKGSADDHWHILFTRRSDLLIEHTGQVAFPGGRSDINDTSPEETAMREAKEEIGLRREHIRILGRLESLLTITNYMVTPIVGVIPWPYEFELALDEVSRIFTIPVAWVADPRNYRIEQREIPPPYSHFLQSNKFPVIHFNPYEGEVLWGVSAEITMRLIKTLLG